jgi:myosin-crossreactive antigen
MEKEFEEHRVEKRGWYWALTGFAFEAWHETDKP